MLNLSNILNSLILNLTYAVLLDTLNAVHACSLGGVNLRCSDNLAIACLQVELEACCGLLNYEFSHGKNPPES